MKFKYSDFEIVPIYDSIRKEEMNDETYFSKTYSKYISNSRLTNIDPKRGGSPEQFRNPPHFNTDSLLLGTYVHELLLQPDEFVLGPKLGKPSAKLGKVIDQIWINRHNGMSIYDSIKEACLKVEYYVNQIDKKIPMIIEKGLEYYKNISIPRTKVSNKEELLLSDKDYDIVSGCIESCNNNPQINGYLHPTDVFGDPIESYFEDAMFMDFLVTYKNSKCVRLKFKLKIDNWTIDLDSKKVTLNDLKTTSHSLDSFMHPTYGSFKKYNYYRQLYVYSMILWHYCQKHYGVSKTLGWNLDCNILAVQTTNTGDSRRFNINRDWLKIGKIEFEMLMKRAAACEMFKSENHMDFA